MLKRGVVVFDATALAAETGHPQSINVVMVVSVSNYLAISPETLLESMNALFPAKKVDINAHAFEMAGI